MEAEVGSKQWVACRQSDFSNQCNQIGLILEGLDDHWLYKSSHKIGQLFLAILK